MATGFIRVIILGNPGNANPRLISLKILNEYTEKKSGLKKIIDYHFFKNSLKEIDRSFAYEIVKGTLRFLIRIDWTLALFSDRKIEKIDFPVLNLLRTAVYQFFYMDRVPNYSIVDESTEIAKKYISFSSSKFVNAVLRKITCNNEFYLNKDRAIEGRIKEKDDYLSIKYSFPVWIIKYWSSMYGYNNTEKICSSLNTQPGFFIRVNNLKTDKNILISLFEEFGLHAGRDFETMDKNKDTKIIFADTFRLLKLRTIKNLPGFKEGFFSIQDFSSQIAVKYFLKPKKGERILDLCGAPGGKATYISELTKNQSEILSIDIDEERIILFNENIRRLNINNIKIMRTDILKKDFLKNHTGEFDKILIDAPCSAFGTISKNPDTKYNKNLKDLERLSNNSIKILTNCKKYLKPGGIIVFYTCTLSEIENQSVIRKFIKNNESMFSVKHINIPAEMKNIVLKTFLEKERTDIFLKKDFFTIMPYFFESEGGFISIIQKKC